MLLTLLQRTVWQLWVQETPLLTLLPPPATTTVRTVLTVLSDDIHADGCCSKLSPSLLAVKYPVLFALLNAAIYYADFGTDLKLAIDVNGECVAYENPPTVLPYINIVVILLHPVVMSAADLFAKGGMGWFGVLLNLTNTRMLYALYKAMAGDSKKNAAAAAKSASDVKLFEAVLESMPQTYLQYIYLLYYPRCAGGEGPLIRSLAISTLSIVFGLATKFEQLFDKSGYGLFALSAWLYFASDALSRGLAVAMAFGALGGTGVAAFAGGWVVADLVWQWLGNRKNWDDVQGGKCGMRCCWSRINGECCTYNSLKERRAETSQRIIRLLVQKSRAECSMLDTGLSDCVASLYADAIIHTYTSSITWRVAKYI